MGGQNQPFLSNQVTRRIVMNNRRTMTLFCAIAIGLVAATSANAGLVMLHSAPNDLPKLSHLDSAPNDLSNVPGAKYYTVAITPNEKITGAALRFTNIPGRTRESDNRLFVNQSVGNNFAGQGRLISNRPDWLGGKLQNLNMANDFSKTGLYDIFSVYSDIAPDTDQANLEFKIAPDSNDLSYDLKPAINTEVQTQIYHHSP